MLTCKSTVKRPLARPRRRREDGFRRGLQEICINRRN